MGEQVDEQIVDDFLQINQQFGKKWFAENAPKEFIQEWFNLRRVPPKPLATNTTTGLVNGNTGHGNSTAMNGKDAIFLSVTNLLSNESIAQLHEDQLTASYAKIAKKGRNSITLELFHDILTRGSAMKATNEHFTRKQLAEKFEGMTEHELFMSLISDVTNELDIDTLCYKILVNVCILTNSDRSSIFLAKGSRTKRYLVAKLFDVSPECPLKQAQMSAEKYKKIPPLPFGTGIVGYVALSKVNVNIEDAYEDERFNKEIDMRTGYHTKSLMCQPILNFGGDVIGVAECINKLSDDSRFSEDDEKTFEKYLTFCGIGIQNAQLFEMSLLEYKRNQLLLSLTKTIFEDTSSLDTLINKVIIRAKGVLDCDKCRVYLVYSGTISEDLQPNELFQTVFELEDNSNEVKKIESSDLILEPDVEYAKKVAVMGKTLNSSKALDDSYQSVESPCVLSVPIRNNGHTVIGVAQLEKTDGRTFNDVDIVTLEAFSIFCGLGIYNCMLYEEAVKLNARQQVALEVLSYHASSTLEETINFMKEEVQSAEVYNINSLDFDDQDWSDTQTCLATVRMFIEMNFLEHFQIPYEVLCRWILSIKKNYRPVIYHNWRHGLNVAQSMYLMLTTYELNSIFSMNEQLALIIASMCHDLDHRGTNNSFQSKSGSPLATLYSTSIMENHHFYHCQLILKAEGNDILRSLSPEDYDEMMKIIEACILSTDLEQYFKKKDKFAELIIEGEMDVNEPEKRELLRAMLMTSCDLAAICKPWKIQKRVAELVASEFFEQGDLERSMHQTPIAMMDRNKKDELPAMQVGFIDYIGSPLYKLLSEFWPPLKPFYTGCLDNRQQWQNLVKK